MSKLDSGHGFLSKVARFVRHPTTNWSELDTLQADPASAYSKEALKALVERKQHNDLVRKREFAALRKIRSRAAAGDEVPGMPPSFFHTSLPSTNEGRASTLKKIDDIEAQMSSQWWQGNGQNAPAAGSSTRLGATQTRRSAAVAAPVPADATPFPDTLPMGLPVAQPLVCGESMPGAAARQVQDMAISTQDIALHPAVEEASIRFANSDDAGAEQVLLQALEREGAGAEPAQEPLVLPALLDFYRATGQRAPFERHAADFARRFNHPPPVWSSPPESVAYPSAQPVPALTGALLGDSQTPLTALEQGLEGTDHWVLPCHGLLRVDFAAAGTLLNWVMDHQAQGRTLQFVGVHGLLAAFFHVIGITAHAQVVPRKD